MLTLSACLLANCCAPHAPMTCVLLLEAAAHGQREDRSHRLMLSLLERDRRAVPPARIDGAIEAHTAVIDVEDLEVRLDPVDILPLGALSAAVMFKGDSPPRCITRIIRIMGIPATPRGRTWRAGTAATGGKTARLPDRNHSVSHITHL
jgi:hypothetical protein